MELRILTIGVDDHTLAIVRSAFLKAQIDVIKTAESFFTMVEGFSEQSYSLIICTSFPEVSSFELAQALRMQAKSLPIMYVSPEGHHEDEKDLIKNGFDKLFFLPMDRLLLETFCRRIEKEITGEGHSMFCSVPIVDLKKGQKAEFDVYIHLPKNEKHIKIVKAGREFHQTQMERIKSAGVSLLFVQESELDKFCQYAAERIKDLTQLDNEPFIVKKQKLEGAARSMFIELLSPKNSSFDDGRQKLNTTHKIIEALIGSQVTDIKSKISDIFAEDGLDIYSHSIRVSTMAAIFSLALMIGKPDELALAGLFHDLGLVKIPEDLWFKDINQMAVEDRQLYIQHPAMALTVISEKKMVLVPTVQEAILQHHECHNGKGYPKGLPGHKISEAAQVLALADRLEELTSKRRGSAALSPLEALAEIQKEGSVSLEIISATKPLLDFEAA